MTSGETAGGRRIRRGRVAVPVAAVVAVVVGVILVAFAQTATYSFGWFAYAPLSDTRFSPRLALEATPSTVLIGIGIVALVFRLGLEWGRRTSSGLLGLVVLLAGVVLVLAGAVVGSMLHDEVDGPTSFDFAFIAGPELTFGQVTALVVGGDGLVVAGLLVLAFWSGRRTAARL